MKKTIIILIMLFVCSASFAKEKLQIAVLDLSANDVSISTAVAVSDYLRRELVNTKRFVIVERKNIDAILKEQAFQRTGCTTNECAVEIGRILNVQQVLVGSISRLGGKIVLEARLVDVEKGDVWIAETSNVEKEEDLDGAAKDITIKIIKKVPLIGQVLLLDGKDVIIDFGRDYGLIKGIRFDVYRQIKEIKDKDGKLLMKDEKKIGEIEVTNTDEGSAKSEIVYQEEKLAVGDIVKVPSAGSKIFTDIYSQTNRWSVSLLVSAVDLNYSFYVIRNDNIGAMIRTRYYLDRQLMWSVELNLGGFYSERRGFIGNDGSHVLSAKYVANIYNICPILVNAHLDVGDIYPYFGVGLYYSYEMESYYAASNTQYSEPDVKYYFKFIPVISAGFDLFRKSNPFIIIDLKYYCPVNSPVSGEYYKTILSVGLGYSFN